MPSSHKEEGLMLKINLVLEVAIGLKCNPPFLTEQNNKRSDKYQNMFDYRVTSGNHWAVRLGHSSACVITRS